VIELGLVARVLLGAIFIWAGIAKIRTPHWSLLAIEAGTPRAVVVALPTFEALLGLALVLQVAPAVMPWVALGVLFVFTITLAQRYATGNRAPCNCFGGKSNDPVNYSTFVRNGALLALALVAAVA
jgi:uncharacterized membrane protein YphA (DoxX/SURF4 family)